MNGTSATSHKTASFTDAVRSTRSKFNKQHLWTLFDFTCVKTNNGVRRYSRRTGHNLLPQGTEARISKTNDTPVHQQVKRGASNWAQIGSWENMAGYFLVITYFRNRSSLVHGHLLYKYVPWKAKSLYRRHCRSTAPRCIVKAKIRLNLTFADHYSCLRRCDCVRAFCIRLCRKFETNCLKYSLNKLWNFLEYLKFTYRRTNFRKWQNLSMDNGIENMSNCQPSSR